MMLTLNYKIQTSLSFPDTYYSIVNHKIQIQTRSNSDEGSRGNKKKTKTKNDLINFIQCMYIAV